MLFSGTAPKRYKETPPMSIRLICWTIAMAYVGFLIVGRGSISALSVSASGALMGGGLD